MMKPHAMRIMKQVEDVFGVTKDDASHLPPSIYDCAKKDMFNRIISKHEEIDSNILIEIING